LFLFDLDPQLIFNFLDVKQNSYLTYLEFRSWMLLIDRTLPEFDILQIFNDIDQNRKNYFSFFFSLINFLDDGLIQYKEFHEYFGHDFLTSEPSIVDLTTLFNEIDINHSGNLTLNELLKFFNHHLPLITAEEGRIFLGTISDSGNEDSISFKGQISYPPLVPKTNLFYFI
jgi:Ca2+-binding EF-hand superfamily protein